MKINKKDFFNIKLLLEKGSITEGKFINKEIVEQFKRNNSVKNGRRTPKLRYIELVSEENLFLCLQNYNYNLENKEEIDLYVEEILEQNPSRDIIQKWHGNSKSKTSPSLKGLYVSSLHKVEIKLNNETLSITPNNGLGYFLFHTETIELLDDTIVVGVENYQVVWFILKYKQFFKAKNILFVMINSYMLEWLSNFENEYIHFGDYDLAGISIYLNKVVPRLRKARTYSMFIPDNIESLIKKHGDIELYEKQKLYSNLYTNDMKVNSLIEVIKKEKKALEQEGLYLL